MFTIKVTLTVLALWGTMLLASAFWSKDALATCEQRHSADTCAYALR